MSFEKLTTHSVTFKGFENYKAVLFDLDGVFIDSTNGWIEALQNVLQKHNFPVPTATQISQIVAKTTKEQLEDVLPYLKINSSTFDDLVTEIDQYFVNNISSTVKLIEGSHELLTKLKNQKLSLVLITNNSYNITELILKNFNLKEYFSYIIAQEDMTRPKPDPSGLFVAIKKLNVKTYQVIYVGDSPTDLGASLKANIPLILIIPPNSPFIFSEIPSSVIIVSSLKDLL